MATLLAKQCCCCSLRIGMFILAAIWFIIGLYKLRVLDVEEPEHFYEASDLFHQFIILQIFMILDLLLSCTIFFSLVFSAIQTNSFFVVIAMSALAVDTVCIVILIIIKICILESIAKRDVLDEYFLKENYLYEGPVVLITSVCANMIYSALFEWLFCSYYYQLKYQEDDYY